MLSAFQHFISEQQLFDPEEHILLTVSGGIDSMVMAEIFRMTGFRFSIAHCNFQLRESESDQDERFVEAYAKKHKIPFYLKRFDVEAHRSSNKESTQLAARNLRYNWFEELRKQHSFSHIATAHHLDDQAETLFINLVRGTGIAGLHGIQVKNGFIIRPMLFANRKEIETFAKEQSIDFREDSSNASDKYLRNYIRHHILDKFYHLNADFGHSLGHSIKRIRKVEKVFKDSVSKTINSMLDLQGEKIIIDIEQLKTLDHLDTYLYEFLELYNFNETHVADLLRTLDDEGSGTQFYSSSHRIIKDRSKILLVPFEEDVKTESTSFIIKEDDIQITSPLNLHISTLNTPVQINSNPECGQFDLNKLQFPLHIRRWKEGDFFYPLGMKNKKKLSDFFIDEKISVYDKEDSWLLCSGNDIVWIVGRRIDDRFKIDESTKQVYKIEIADGTH